MTEPDPTDLAESGEWSEDDLKGQDIHPPVYLPAGEVEESQ